MNRPAQQAINGARVAPSSGKPHGASPSMVASLLVPWGSRRPLHEQARGASPSMVASLPPSKLADPDEVRSKSIVPLSFEAAWSLPLKEGPD